MVAEATINKYTNELLALYIDRYTSLYGKTPVMNRFKQKWGFRAMYEDLGLAQAKKVIEHYFKTERFGHPIDYLLYNYEKLNLILIELEKDAVDREQLRKETEQRVREWEASGNK
jgi:hypothetical protein